MPNPTGKNGAGKKIYPPDDELKRSLEQYVRWGLTQEQKIERLVKDHNLSIRTTKLNDIERRLEIPSVRRTRAPREVAAQAVADEMDKDIAQNNGPNFVKSKLTNKLVMVTRDEVRRLMHEFNPLGAERRYPGYKKNRVYRHPLSALGPFHEVSSDGHEKIGPDALKMGDIGLPIYGWKDKWTADLLKIDVVPNSRTNAAIGHLFLDFIEEYGGIALQSTTDKGSEVGWLEAIRTILWEQCAPDINPNVYPAHRSIKSVHNTVIEAFWRWLREKLGINLRDHILRGKTEHIFDPNVVFHRDLFNWIFPPLVQAELNEFRTWWNQHQIRSQRNKNMPSGHVPADALEHPEFYGGINCFIKVPKEMIVELREFLTEEVGPRSKHLDWVDAEFATLAKSVHDALGSPQITLTNSWEIFKEMSTLIENM
ncbi:hypothetical protein C8F04DRAFT_1314842 [Mycena alexandri]|uniref:Integrase core domain-containing protein n=1 Tax=Mycena alexandri TaxID=1745969 RepID=A0AAD6S7K8_9AGAR|nr:hypothetical protein C8F04DRAFT_1314842 [Mycena alexandri]